MQRTQHAHSVGAASNLGMSYRQREGCTSDANKRISWKRLGHPQILVPLGGPGTNPLSHRQMTESIEDFLMLGTVLDPGEMELSGLEPTPLLIPRDNRIQHFMCSPPQRGGKLFKIIDS